MSTVLPPITLSGDALMPRLGFGVFRAGAATRSAVLTALQVGYRHIDTARVYKNEADVGEAIRLSGVRRDELFVTTKLWNEHHGYDEARRACDESLRLLGLDRLDLFLIHWPAVGKRAETWRAMEAILADGKARAIGVSNYMVHHLRELEGTARVLPAINQIELHPFLQQRDVVARCGALGIAVSAYSPLTKGKRLADPALGAIARDVGRTPAQVLIRWCLQRGWPTMPKSVTPERIAENFGALDFALSDDVMRRLTALEDGTRCAWDPSTVV
ncbi:MAG: aldo/keto reductase [Myxococcales bacterium]|nr:aldo/keto reductase [Myxococcales bacterium]